MANDVDMWNDLERMSKRGTDAALDLFECYEARYINGDLDLAERLKQQFTERWGYWGNYY